ncbi:MAG: bifunctional tetrahydrofolate synthase/dihydrofolate synthase [Thiotrichaceae bacterium]|nr:bifunctional tetrahydrofolate synthase/dihydrofolate synthase [Thiotrichaceae bacterium]PCI14094.1 MAG: bifunctional tetrahydrofolate synthase/dihydrofolate synthase [Thiotrichales bacterium]
MRFDSLDAWLTWQGQLNPTEIELGLERVRVVLQRLQLASPDFAVITIAGTNGKGSSVAMLQSIYRAAGYHVGAYTSPHLQRYNERITLNGVEADDALLCDAFEQIELARCADEDEIPLTYFEFGTLAAIVIFQQARVDIGVLEIGLGGRLDAVNAIEPDIALVTMVDVDHQSWLGNDRETIAREKAGIYRANLPAICAEPKPARSLVAHAAAIGAQYYGLNGQFSYGLVSEVNDGSWFWQCDQQQYEALPPLGLSGAFQLQNAAGVLMAVTLLQLRFAVALSAIESGLKQVRVAGRLQRVVLSGAHVQVECLLDVAHNPSSAQVLCEALLERPCEGETHAVVAMLADKDIAAVIATMTPVITRWHVASLDAAVCDRGASAETLAACLTTASDPLAVSSFDDVAGATAAALANARAGDRVVIFGSFYTVAAAKTFFEDVGCCAAN